MQQRGLYGFGCLMQIVQKWNGGIYLAAQNHNIGKIPHEWRKISLGAPQYGRTNLDAWLACVAIEEYLECGEQQRVKGGALCLGQLPQRFRELLIDMKYIAGRNIVGAADLGSVAR